MIIKNLNYQLRHCNILNVFTFIHAMYKEEEDSTQHHSINDVVFNYSKVMIELLDMQDNANVDDQYTLSINLVKEESDFIYGGDYIDVSIINTAYVEEPDSTLALWGGNESNRDDCPSGCYNINWIGYQKTYGVAGLDRRKFLLSDIEISDDAWEHMGHNQEMVIANILWELTFYGYSENDCVQFWNNILTTDNASKSIYEQSYQ